MSVRPITEGEIKRAYGEPWKTYGSIFGALLGINSYMVSNQVSFLYSHFLIYFYENNNCKF